MQISISTYNYLFLKFGNPMPLLDDVCKVFYPHLSKENILEKARKMDFPFKCVRLDKSQKSPYFIDLKDLSIAIDKAFQKDSPYIDTDIHHALNNSKE
ncbi:pyocin activator PrtN family protein [Acinetobacter sp. AM]|uniref:pyocin activator PrtN family protein n=1 Tax=Acinetobacter sp. AM TaxID=2170730 RepID=UPI001D175C9F|nr:pyocin activator PrtN family protein [Acinetobacter sp. AM]